MSGKITRLFTTRLTRWYLACRFFFFLAWTCWWSLFPLFGSVLWIWMLFMISQLSLYPLESVFPFWPIRHCCKGAFQMKLSLALRTGCDRVFFWRGGEALKFSFTNKWHCTIWRCSWQIGPQKGIFFFLYISVQGSFWDVEIFETQILYSSVWSLDVWKDIFLWLTFTFTSIRRPPESSHTSAVRGRRTKKKR